MLDFIELLCKKTFFNIKLFWEKFKEATFITKHQYRLRFLHYQKSKKHKQAIAIMQVIIKRITIKLSLRYLASSKLLIKDIHPVDACKISFIANIENNGSKKNIPLHIKSHDYSCPIIKQPSTLIIKSQAFDYKKNETIFTLKSANSNDEITISAENLSKNHSLLYGLGSLGAVTIGQAASEDLLRNEKNTNENIQNSDIKKNATQNKTTFYHILCIIYVGLVISGISIVRRMFPFHIPGTELIVPFGAGIVFFPLTFAIQDITTEIYGYSHSRQMVWMSIIMILFYVLYTQIAINMPTAIGSVYENNPAFSVVYATIPRQLLALIISMLAGNLINDFFISKSKVIFAGQYLWARLLGSTMIGEAVLQIVGGVIGFSDTLDFRTQLLPNMILAYGYKQLWNAALIPIIYIITSSIKRKEGIDVYDYNINYSPFSFNLNNTKLGQYNN